MQFTINSFRQLFPDNSLIFSKIPDISLTAVKFQDISRFSRQVVTLYNMLRIRMRITGLTVSVSPLRRAHLSQISFQKRFS